MLSPTELPSQGRTLSLQDWIPFLIQEQPYFFLFFNPLSPPLPYLPLFYSVGLFGHLSFFGFQYSSTSAEYGFKMFLLQKDFLLKRRRMKATAWEGRKCTMRVIILSPKDPRRLTSNGPVERYTRRYSIRDASQKPNDCTSAWPNSDESLLCPMD